MSGINGRLGGSEPRVRARFQHTPTSEARCVRAPPDSVPSSGTSSTTGAALLGAARDCAGTARGRASAGLVHPVPQVYGIGWPDGKARFVQRAMTATRRATRRQVQGFGPLTGNDDSAAAAGLAGSATGNDYGGGR